MENGPRIRTEGVMVYDNSSRIEPKRFHQGFEDGTEAELLPNKKQAVEVPNHNTFSGLVKSNIYPWGNASSFPSVAGHFSRRLCDPETAWTMNFDDRSVRAIGLDNMDTERKVTEGQFESDPSFCLSISHTLDDPRLGFNFGGIRKVKVSQVKGSEDLLSVSLGQAYAPEDNSTVSALAYIKPDDSPIPMGLSFNRNDLNLMSVGDTFNREDSYFPSTGQLYNKEDSDISTSHSYEKNNGVISMGHFLCKNENNRTATDQAFCKEVGNTLFMDHIFMESQNAASIIQPFNKDDKNSALVCHTFHEDSDNSISMGHSNSGNENNISMVHSYNKDNNSSGMCHSFGNGESRIISFGGSFNDDDDISTFGRPICSYDLLTGQPSVQISESLSEKGVLASNFGALACAAQTASGEIVLKEQKVTKKAPQNNFPSNVRSLMSTGMLDGVPVKYMAWSREKELRGIIKGSGYLCGCQSCNFSKVINAYEFERHADCKTKHPNNHIYFENGKTIYGIVQELKNTPQNMLFEVIQTITGSPINQKSFRLWKESFLVATRELQRIYGKDGAKQCS